MDTTISNSLFDLAPNTDKDVAGKSRKSRVLDVLQKIAEQLKYPKRNKAIRRIVELIILLDLNERRSSDTSTRGVRSSLAVWFFEEMRSSTNEEFEVLLSELEIIFLSHKLRKLTVKLKDVSEICQLGNGGFGVVFRGCLRKPDGSVEEVAIKKPLYAAVHCESILNEAVIMSLLDHENVVKILGFQESPLIVMEYLDWGGLDQAIKAHDFTGIEILNALLHVASGMEYIHSKKIIHRDLSVRNIFVNSQKVCKVGDLGIAVYFGNKKDGRIQNQGGLFAMYHTAPEVKITQIFSKEMDVWSFGVLIWELYNMLEPSCPPELLSLQLEYYCLWEPFGRPDACPKKLFHYVLNNILTREPSHRDNFTAIKNFFQEEIAVVVLMCFNPLSFILSE